MNRKNKYSPKHLPQETQSEAYPGVREEAIQEEPAEEPRADVKHVEERRMEEKKTKKKRRVPLAIWIVAALMLLIICGSYFGVSYFYSRMNIQAPASEKESQIAVDDSWKELISNEELGNIDKKLQENLESESDWDYSAANVTNILLIGVDNDYALGMNERGNADGIIIASINKTTKQVVLTSLMRDIYVSVPGAYNTKLTLTYHYGGTQVLIDTIEANFGIPIDNYILVNYLNVIDIVDAVGGLTFDVSADELFWMDEKIRNLNELLGLDGNANLIDPSQAGTLLLNGVQTAAYMRIRYAGNGDFDRTERARNVLMGLKDKAMGMGVTELVSFANVILPMITTDLSQGKAIGLVMNAPTLLGYKMVSNRVPVDDSWYFADLDGAVVIIDFPVNREFLSRSIYEGIA